MQPPSRPQNSSLIHAAAAVAALLAAGCAHAGREPVLGDPRGAGGATMLARYQRNLEPERTGGVSDLGTIGLDGRVVLGRTIGWAPMVDLELGGARRAALHYRVALLPVGLGLRVGRGGLLSVAAGGALGATWDRIPFSWELPVQLALEVDLGTHVRAVILGRAAWLTRAARQDDDLPAAVDEVGASVGLRIGRRLDRHFRSIGGEVGRGTLVTVGYQRLMGAGAISVLVGWNITAAR